MNNSKIIDDILSCQISSSNKIGLGYDKGMNSEPPSPTMKVGNKRSYADVLKDSIKKEDKQNMILFKMEGG